MINFIKNLFKKPSPTKKPSYKKPTNICLAQRNKKLAAMLRKGDEVAVYNPEFDELFTFTSLGHHLYVLGHDGPYKLTPLGGVLVDDEVVVGVV